MGSGHSVTVGLLSCSPNFHLFLQVLYSLISISGLCICITRTEILRLHSYCCSYTMPSSQFQRMSFLATKSLASRRNEPTHGPDHLKLNRTNQPLGHIFFWLQRIIEADMPTCRAGRYMSSYTAQYQYTLLRCRHVGTLLRIRDSARQPAACGVLLPRSSGSGTDGIPKGSDVWGRLEPPGIGGLSSQYTPLESGSAEPTAEAPVVSSAVRGSAGTGSEDWRPASAGSACEGSAEICASFSGGCQVLLGRGSKGNMELRLRRLLLLALICLHAPRWASAQQPEEATVIVKGSSRIAATDDNYVCATIDWWPPEKCNYNQCPWGQASILNLDLDHPFLAQAIQAFDHLRIRLGGSLQDRVVYDVGTESPCSPFTNASNGLFGFSVGCLGMDRWDKLNDLFQRTGALVTFGVNALYGRYNVRRSIWAGKWNSTNAYDFVKYTISKGYPVGSWEFGNELSGHGIGAKVDAKLYGKDVIEFKSILRQLYKAPLSQPLLLAPGGFFDQQWYSQLLETSGHGVVNALSHHVYNLGGGNDVHLIRKILDPKYLDRAEDTYRDMQLTIQRHGTWASAWVSESGGVFNNGGQLVSNTFINSIWYLDQLGMASKYNTKVFCRQTLIGGNYGLLDTETFLPNPDYYSALLWHRLMGNGVLSVDINAPRQIRAYAHCRRQQQGITLLLINLSNTTGYNVTLQNDINVSLGKRPDLEKRSSFTHRLKKAVSWLGRKPTSDTKRREEYHLTAKDGDLQSKTMLLNGVPLELGDAGSIPAMDPVLVAVDSPVHLAPTSIAFVVLPKFEAKACS